MSLDEEITEKAAVCQSDILAHSFVTIIKPSRGWADLRLQEIWEYRELLYILAWRDVKVKYKQAVLGVAWTVLQPLLSVLIFTVIFGKLAKIPFDGKSYALFALAALLPWQLFSTALTHAGSSLVGNANLLTKVYFPRLIIPMSAVLSGVIDFAVSFVLMLVMMALYNIPPSWLILTLPFFVIFALITAFAVGIWLSALNVEYRDVQYMIPFLIQIGLYASPVVYSANLIPAGPWRILYGLNPMTGVIQGFRWALLGGEPPNEMFLASVGMVIFLLITGLWNFKRMERTFADRI
ncbi:MAG: ABC transporter permease [bacterium]